MAEQDFVTQNSNNDSATGSSVTGSVFDSLNSASDSNKASGASSDASSGAVAPNYATMPVSDRASFDAVDARTANFEFIENDGTKLTGQFQAPDLNQAEKIADKRFDWHASDDGEQVMNMNNAAFHEALFKYVIKTIVVEPADGGNRAFEKPTWAFFDKHREAYHFIIDKAATFFNGN